jgi:CheY-like chemotaxis protein
VSQESPSNRSEAAARRRSFPLDSQQAGHVWQLNTLLVDDDPADASLILGVLVRHPKVSAARVVTEPALALSQLLVGHRQPDLVLLDVRMPQIDGFTFLEALRRIPGMASVPVVFLTTSGLEKDVLAYKRGSASMYVVKPDTLGELRTRMDGIVERAISGVWTQTATPPQQPLRQVLLD